MFLVPFVCLSVFGCFSAALLKNDWPDFDEICWEVVTERNPFNFGTDPERTLKSNSQDLLPSYFIKCMVAS